MCHVCDSVRWSKHHEVTCVNGLENTKEDTCEYFSEYQNLQLQAPDLEMKIKTKHLNHEQKC